ncbi:hypothetical protein AKG11_28255 [Shinella sp. SUS2]|uniref:DUF3331 domain-containing protein n=1 Tax=unclassified Shinella TaxID=2643062 RepID=UPI000680F4CA|nr:MULTISPECIES: DUF3331 domain-containing protein [unclassified Shinella]KNY13629.1 hypothetical protein AKG11_28255 [Shinella sp. SUS2]KOC72522.1 hypothetical protein AKG10_27120 [Shinella sp. GWS1]
MSIYLPIITMDGVVWALCTARKATTCHLSHRPIQPGDKVYRPISNGSNRMRRIKATRAHLDVAPIKTGGAAPAGGDHG